MLSGLKHVSACNGQETEFDDVDMALADATAKAKQFMQPAYVLSPVAVLTPTVNVVVDSKLQDASAPSKIPATVA
jgi:hypothetical protein